LSSSSAKKGRLHLGPAIWKPATAARARQAVAEFRIEGPKNNLPFFAELLDNAEFVAGAYDTGIIGRMRAPSTKEGQR
jgi:acetyl-CoA carboxylase biotin carboxylase subunit